MPARNAPQSRRRRAPSRTRSGHTTRHSIQPGDRVRVRAESSDHDYEPGKVYEVLHPLPNGNTCILADPHTGATGSPILYEELEHLGSAHTLGWDWLKTILPPHDVQLLSAFDGLERLTLRDEIKDRIVEQLPNLQQQLLEQTASETGAEDTQPNESD